MNAKTKEMKKRLNCVEMHIQALESLANSSAQVPAELVAAHALILGQLDIIFPATRAAFQALVGLELAADGMNAGEAYKDALASLSA